MRLGRELLDLNIRGLYAIGTVGLEPMPVVIKNYVRNVALRRHHRLGLLLLDAVSGQHILHRQVARSPIRAGHMS